MTDSVTVAAKACQPDADCVRAGDAYLTLVIRSWAAAGLSDRQIADRLLAAERGLCVAPRPDEAAWAMARHVAAAGEPLPAIIEAVCAVDAPAWPDDPDLLAFIATSAEEEFRP